MRKTVATVWLLALVFVLTLSVVYPQNMAQESSPRPARDINAVLAAHDKELLAIPDVVGVYDGTTEDGRTRCLKVMLARKNPESEGKIPRMIAGYPAATGITRNIRPPGQP